MLRAWQIKLVKVVLRQNTVQLLQQMASGLMLVFQVST
jgi:hypothetical protein